ncbi:MAG: hypothetical protein Q7T33_02075 [Dehalococcoidia bacterium]|nr:hypothetical protein [Dehalococcoidia bacterium]
MKTLIAPTIEPLDDIDADYLGLDNAKFYTNAPRVAEVAAYAESFLRAEADRLEQAGMIVLASGVLQTADNLRAALLAVGYRKVGEGA